jgi:hypothetical protein
MENMERREEISLEMDMFWAAVLFCEVIIIKTKMFKCVLSCSDSE